MSPQPPDYLRLIEDCEWEYRKGGWQPVVGSSGTACTHDPAWRVVALYDGDTLSLIRRSGAFFIEVVTFADKIPKVSDKMRQAMEVLR
jgi:hypothetical protein